MRLSPLTPSGHAETDYAMRAERNKRRCQRSPAQRRYTKAHTPKEYRAILSTLQMPEAAHPLGSATRTLLAIVARQSLLCAHSHKFLPGPHTKGAVDRLASLITALAAAIPRSFYGKCPMWPDYYRRLLGGDLGETERITG